MDAFRVVALIILVPLAIYYLVSFIGLAVWSAIALLHKPKDTGYTDQHGQSG